jgi:hypothetical protein
VRLPANLLRTKVAQSASDLAVSFNVIAELRSYEALDEAHRSHFADQPVPLDRTEYATFLREVHEYFDGQGYQVTVVTPGHEPPPGEELASAAKPGGGLATGLALGAVAVIALAAAAFSLAHR